MAKENLVDLAANLTGLPREEAGEDLLRSIGMRGAESPFTAEELAKSMKEVGTNRLFAESKASLDRQEALLAELAKQPVVAGTGGAQNLLMFLSGADPASLKAPAEGESKKEHLASLLKGMQNIQTQRKGLLGELANLARINATAKKKGVTPTAIANIEKSWAKNIDDFLTDENEKFSETNEQLGIIDAALRQHGLSMTTTVLAQIARQVSGEKGVLTNKDIGRVLPFTFSMLGSQINAALSGDPNAPVDPKIINALRKVVAVGKPIMYQQSLKRIKDKQGRIAANPSVRKFAPQTPDILNAELESRKAAIEENMQNPGMEEFLDPEDPEIKKLYKELGKDVPLTEEEQLQKELQELKGAK